MTTPTTAKQRLITKLDEWIASHEKDKGVATQMNVSHARDQRHLLSQVSDSDAEAMERAIIEKESYDPAKDKYGFGPVTVSPLDYLAFLDQASRHRLIPRDDDATTRTLYVMAVACIDSSDLDEDDKEVEGVYLVEGIDTSLGDGDAADTALASFHAHQGVAVLDDFDFIVLDPVQKIVLEPDHSEDREELECVKLGDIIENWMANAMGNYARR